MSGINLSLFSQITTLLDRQAFGRIVKARDTDKHAKGINSWTHLVSMLFVHLAKVDSVRDISQGLRSAYGNLSHLVIQRVPSKSSVSYINAHREGRCDPRAVGRWRNGLEGRTGALSTMDRPGGDNRRIPTAVPWRSERSGLSLVCSN